MTFFAMIGWAFMEGCVVVAFFLPIAFLIRLFSDSEKTKGEGAE